MVTRGRLREKIRPFVKKFRGVAQISRLSIVYLLAHGPLGVREIVHHIGLAENLVSHHLRQLRLSGWVVKAHNGREVTYSLHGKAFLEFNRLFEDTPFFTDKK